MFKISRSSEIIFTAKTLLFLTFLFIFYLLGNYLYVRETTLSDIQEFLSQTNKRIDADLVYKDGWDTSLYVNDNQTSQDRPLYIITTDGFIIDRIKPISGFLDTSDFRFSSSFEHFQTITTPVNEQWRLYSNNIAGGTIIVGYYQPEVAAIKSIDNQLTSTVAILLSDIHSNGDKIDISGINLKKVSVKLAIEVVNKSNHVLLTAGGIPAYIDRSYLTDIPLEKYQTISDAKTGEPFLVSSRPIFDSSGSVVAVILSGYSLAQINKYLAHLLVFSTISGAIALALMFVVITYLLKKEIVEMAEIIKRGLLKSIPIVSRGSVLIFDRQKSAIYCETAVLKVPYATLQYDICKVLFSSPSKRWEYDEILEKMGEDSSRVKSNWRKIYDAARNLNEKGKQIFGANIILFESKTFRLNPQIPPQKVESN